MKIKLHSVFGKIQASIIKDQLNRAGLSATIAPGNDSIGLNTMSSMEPNCHYDIFIEKEEFEQAKKILVEYLEE